MQVTCPSCKLGGTIREEQILEEEKEIHCPNCNTKFRVKKNQPAQASLNETVRQVISSPLQERLETLQISCPACGSQGKIRPDAFTSGQRRLIACRACGKTFTFALPDDIGIPVADTLLPDSDVGGSTICPSCGSGIARTVPICTACGRRIRGTTIRCPSCESTNVGIGNGSEKNGGDQRETTIFRPLILPTEKLGGIKIPLWCRDCGRSWKIEPALIPTAGKSARSSDKGG